MAKAKKTVPGSSLFDQPVKTDLPEIVSVVLREGTVLHHGQEVFIHPGVLRTDCAGKILVIEKMTAFEYCESKVLIIAYLKENPEKRTVGKEGKGIDSNWFKQIDS